MQVFGGHGFIKEWGVEQYVRDARINLIYEGTNTIQSLDLIGRKVLQDGGQKLGKFGKLVQDFIKANADKPEMKEFIEPLMDIGDTVTKLPPELGQISVKKQNDPGAPPVP